MRIFYFVAIVKRGNANQNSLHILLTLIKHKAPHEN